MRERLHNMAKETINLSIIKLEHGKDLPLPSYATHGSAGFDLYAAINEDITLQPMERKLISVGFKMAIEHGFEMQIRPRSGLAFKHGITCLNTPGTIDSDYRGEVFVLLINLGQEAFKIERGMRIAQAIVSPVQQVNLIEIDEVDKTTRGEGGFGSTGY